MWRPGWALEAEDPAARMLTGDLQEEIGAIRVQPGRQSLEHQCIEPLNLTHRPSAELRKGALPMPLPIPMRTIMTDCHGRVCTDDALEMPGNQAFIGTRLDGLGLCRTSAKSGFGGERGTLCQFPHKML